MMMIACKCLVEIVELSEIVDVSSHWSHVGITKLTACIYNGFQCLLVKGWKGSSWSFPRGKKSKDEEDYACAIREMRSERGGDLCLRIGVKQGGCSGMSYTMDFENRANVRPDDSTIEYQGFAIARWLYEKVVKLSEGFNGADMRNTCTEARMLALRAGRDYVVPNDFIKVCKFLFYI
ncbi:hypothetical protein F2Q69_00002959 [Brassica cretica]|uniref:AAA ATPase AAA+ lid domain-containing protein n=1 Tax=Brassica cretica TaxID=69181 RepID=A0A8S9NNE2_BRACR|nr:hypothetical protein F2Q69_00002959 [Brassica cretica]